MNKDNAEKLTIANKEITFHQVEKGKRAAELVLANKELIFQNKEKEKRAAELIIANKELLFQNEEKEKRAQELIIANKELIFQNQEKENRAIELNASREQLKAVNDELESFAYSVSHDMRAPLRAIHGYTNILKEDYAAKIDAEGNRVLNNIITSAKKMGQLIDDLLTFSRLGRQELNMVNINMHALVSTIGEDLKSAERNRDIELHIQELQPAVGDQSTIKQVWVNLISNAIKYTNTKGKAIIEVGSEIKGDEIMYYIRDNGAGFDMRFADKLFGVFQRLHSDEEFEGTGVGLAIVQRILLKHFGRVWAEGKVNEGAVFYFTLKKLK